MAEEIALDIKIQTAESSKTVQELKKSLKELKNELNNVEAGSAQFNKLTHSINNTEGKLGDLNDSFQTLTGSGVERANKSFKLFTEGLTNFDLGKIKSSLGGLGAAFKAIPIFLIVEGVMYLIQNFKELSSGSGILAKALKPIGDLIGWITDGLYALTDAIGLTNSELDKMGENLVESSKKTSEALAEQTKEFDRQIAAAKASGKNTVEIEIAKQKAIQATNDMLIRQAIAIIDAGGELTEEQARITKAAIESNKDAANQIKVIQLTAQKEADDDYKKRAKERADENKKKNDEFEKEQKRIIDLMAQFDKEDAEAAEKKAKAEEDLVLLRMENSLRVSEYNKQKAIEETEFAAAQKKKQSELEQARVNEVLAFAKMNTESQAQLANFLFDLKRKNAVKGSAEDLKLAKRQFQLNKALAIQTSIISGIQGVINALSAQSVIPEPYGTILKVANAVGVGIAATINTAKIASQQFNPDGGGAGATPDVNMGGGGATASAPAIAQPNNSVTKISDEGKVIDKPMNQRVFVLETDITDSTKKITSIEESAKIH